MHLVATFICNPVAEILRPTRSVGLRMTKQWLFQNESSILADNVYW